MALSKNGVHTAYLLNLMVDHHFHHSDFKCARKKTENQTPIIFTWFVSNFAHVSKTNPKKPTKRLAAT